MKKFWFMATAAVMLFVSCADDDVTKLSGGTGASQAMSFTASYGENGTRATLNGNNELFDANDAISVLSMKNANKKFVTADGGATVTFTGNAEADQPFYALYPYQEGLSLSGNTISGASIPSTQWNDCWAEGGKNGWDPSAPLAYAVASPEHMLYFHNLCAILKITIPEINDNVTITVGADNPLSGACTITDGILSVNTTGGSNTVKVGDDEKKVKGGCDVYVAIAPGTYSKFYVSAENGINTTRRSKTSATFEANKIYDLGLFEIDIHEAVDLGLPSGTLWATCNVGASKPEEYGNYYAWGEVETKNVYTIETYKHSKNDYIIKYNTVVGFIDNKSSLDSEDDVAHVKWGGDWRIPTPQELNEITYLCNWTWTLCNGVYGYRLTSRKNNNSIFLPAAGGWLKQELIEVGSIGCYWSSSIDVQSYISAYTIQFTSDKIERLIVYRPYGMSVRPVRSRNQN